MIRDFQNMFDHAAVITVTRNSTNAIDLQRAAQDLGNGEPLKIYGHRGHGIHRGRCCDLAYCAGDIG